MAYVGSFTFGIDSKVEASIVLDSWSHHRPKLNFSARRPRKWMNFGCLSDSATGFSRFLSDDAARLSLYCNCEGPRTWRFKRVKAMEEESGESEVGEESDDALQATIEKSKKVLAMQKQLLQQIKERKKLVSSIKNSITDPEDGYIGTGSNSSSGLTSTTDGTEGNHGPIVSQTTGMHKTGDTLEDKRLLAVSKDLKEDAKKPTHIPLKGISSSANSPKAPKEDTSSGAGRAPSNELPSSRLKAYVASNSKTSKSVDSGKPSMNTMNAAGSSPKNSIEVDKQEQSKSTTTGTVQSDVSPSLSKSFSTYGWKNAKQEESRVDELNINGKDPVNEDVKPLPLAGPNVMNVILVAAECAPWSKTGGLGDVAGALPKALARRGHRVMVVAPRYGNYAETQDAGVRRYYKVDGQDFEVTYFQAYIDGVDFVFMDCSMFRHIENNIYGGNRVDILKRMVLFCRAAVEVPWYVPCGGVCYGDGNLVFIANDWHTALLPVYLKAYYRDNGLMKYTRSVLVIHNIAHQGRGPLDDFSYVDLPPHYLDLFRLYDPLGGEHFNIFAAGLKAADRIVTVSHGYVWELKTPEGGWGLHGIINDNHWKLQGIVNGIDTKDWSPEVDVHLKSDGYVNYSLKTLQTGKSQCKAALQRELGLPVRSDVPLIGFIGRLDHQKGVDVIAEAVPWIVGQDVQLVMLGTGRADLEQMLRQFECQYRDKVRGWVGFSVKTAHRITAGADILLMPSRFEPCGLNQLYAMQYGTIPVVHAVGGLRDTVQPFDPFSESGLGWTFDRAESNRLIDALGNCLLTYRQYKQSWEGLQRRGMTQDLSWDNAARIYEEVLVAAKYQW